MIRILALLLILLLPSVASAQTNVIPFTDASGTTYTATVGGNGTYVGGADISARQATGYGSFPKAANFTGSPDAVTVPAVNAASGTAYTIVIGARATSGLPVLMGRTNNVSPVYWPNSTTFRIRQGTTNSDFVFSAIDANWHVYMWCKSTGDNLRAFRDGVESSTGPINNTASATQDRLGTGLTASVNHVGDMTGYYYYDSDQSANAVAIYNAWMGANGFTVNPLGSGPPQSTPTTLDPLGF